MCTCTTKWGAAGAGAAADAQCVAVGCVLVWVTMFWRCLAVAFVYDQVVFVCLDLYLAAESYGRVVSAVCTGPALSVRCLFVGCRGILPVYVVASCTRKKPAGLLAHRGSLASSLCIGGWAHLFATRCYA